MIAGDGEALRELATGWAGGIDAHLGQGEGLRVRRRVEDRTLRARDEYDVLLRPHARRDRPHDVADVEDVDVVVHHYHIFGVELGAERGHDGNLRLSFGDLF